MTSSDAPQPPGGPLRQDAAQGGFKPGDDDLDTLDEQTADHGSDDSKPVPPVSGEPTQPEDDAELQEENAETSMDQPSQ